MDSHDIIGFDTRAIHADQHPDPATDALIPAIYATSTYAQQAPNQNKGYDYARFNNPTRQAFEKAVAALENAKTAFAFASGMAAIAAVLDLLDKDSHIVAVDDIYGGTFQLFEKLRRRTSGLTVDYVDLSKPENLDAALKPNTRMLWLETPTNPLLKLADIEALAARAKTHNLLTVVDNTFATPWSQRPLDLGADITLHSTTKYINGHSDIIGGLVALNRPDLIGQLKFISDWCGAIASPFDCFLAHRGVKTLGLRMERHSANALELARWLEDQKEVERVYYQGLPSHPQHTLAKKQMQNGFGGMVSFVIKGDLARTTRFLKSTRVFTLAKSLGGIESLSNHPATMTHAGIPPATREKLGIVEGLIRLSVGIEDLRDLKADLERGFHHTSSQKG